MISLKTIGMLLILGASSVTGFRYAEGFRKRCVQLEEVQRAVYQLQGEVEYTYTPIPEALLNVANKSKEPITHILREISSLLDENVVADVYEAFKLAFDNNKASLFLNNEDINIVLDMAKGIGGSNIEGHKKIFNYTLEKLKNQVEIAEDIAKKNVKMYRYLGVTVGGMAVIMLI